MTTRGIEIDGARAFFRDGRISAWNKLLALLAVLYVISPIDLIPDVPVVGWLDDAGVVAAVAAYYLHQFARRRQVRAGEATVDVVPTTR
jgi:uncharacterized membrane protein YkvA (DUF1232 family)